MRKKILLSLVGIFFLIAVLVFRPVPIVAENKAIAVSGIVEKIKLTGGNDFVFKLKNNPTKYYINRGVEAGLDFENFKSAVLEKKVVVKYPKYWTPLDWNNSVRHVSKVELSNQILFNELKP